MALDFNGTNIEGNVELSGEDLEAVNQILQQSVGTDINGGLQILGYLGLGINILYIAIFIASSIGLYKLSKKLGDDHSWLAFIPLVQLYTYFKTAGYTFWKGLLLLILNCIFAFVISVVVMMGLSPIINSFIGSGDMRSLMMVSLISSLVITAIMMIVATFFLYAGMARRAGQSNGTAILMTLFPWCMLWIVANRIQQHNPTEHAQSAAGITQDSVLNTEL